MKIDKVINNNLVRSHNEDRNEVLVMGCGLGFKKKVGDPIDSALIEKVYVIEDKTTSNQLVKLLSTVPQEHIRVANIISNYARTSLDKKLSDSVFIALADHISFAIERADQGIFLKNALIWEIKRYYNHEFLVGKEALEIIRQHLGVELPEDEAGYIAMHLVAASIEAGDMERTTDSVKMIQRILQIIKYHFNMELDEYSVYYERLVTHLKFFSQRLMQGKSVEGVDEGFVNFIQREYAEASKCVQKIGDYIKREFEKDLTDDERVYLTVHIARVTTK